MKLTDAQVQYYQENGILTIPSLFSKQEIDVLLRAFERDSRRDGPYIIRESGDDVRAVYASHLREPQFDRLIRDSRFLGCARQLADYEMYLYQFKINSKPAFGGESWAWHYDFAVWNVVDQLQHPNQVNVALFLDDVTEFNGPIIFIPGSHLEDTSKPDVDGAGESTHVDPMAYSPDDAEMSRLVARHGMVAPKGPAGTVVFFHSRVVHGSAMNMSPDPRKLLIVTYNDVDNAPRSAEPRADYIIGPVTAPLRIEELSLLEEA